MRVALQTGEDRGAREVPRIYRKLRLLGGIAAGTCLGALHLEIRKPSHELTCRVRRESYCL